MFGEGLLKKRKKDEKVLGVWKSTLILICRLPAALQIGYRDRDREQRTKKEKFKFVGFNKQSGFRC